MKKLILMIGMLLSISISFGQVFETTLTNVDLYKGNNFQTFVSSHQINYTFVLNNDNNRIIITDTQSNSIISAYGITNKRIMKYKGNDFMVMDIYNGSTTGNVIIVDQPIKTDRMQLLFNFSNEKSLIFDTNFKLY